MVLPLLARGAAALAAKKAATEIAKKQTKKQTIDEVAEAEAKNLAARKAAEEGAKESVEGGVKVTRYPYAGKRVEAEDAAMKPDITGEIPVMPALSRMGRTPPKYAKGGVTRADGCAQRGHTKGKIR